MPDPKPRLVNVAQRPLELHGPDGEVRVLNPGQTVDADDIGAQDKLHLARGALQPMRSEDPPAPPAKPEANPAPAARKAKSRKGEPA